MRNPLFASMEFIDSEDEFARRLPLMSAGRDFSTPVALNWTAAGTDVDFGSLSRQLAFGVEQGMDTMFGNEVRDLDQESDGSWTVKVVNRRTGEKVRLRSKFVFVGAGGGAPPLLQKSGISEVRGFWRFPVSGEWLRTSKADLTSAHHAKGLRAAADGCSADVHAAPGHPGDQRQGLAAVRPFAGWSPKFLKNGKVTDLPLSVKPNNLASMIGVGLTELPLLKYLIGELLQSPEDRVDTLRSSPHRGEQ